MITSLVNVADRSKKLRGFFLNTVTFGEKTVFVLENIQEWLKDNPDVLLRYIYAENYPWLENHILQNAGNIADAQDVFQEGLSAAWINLQTGKFVGSRNQFTGYVRQICKYKWIDTLRSRNRLKVSYVENIPEQGIEDFSGVDLEESRLLKKCFTTLGEKCRKVLGLFYYQKKSLAEIARDLQNTEDSIKTIKYRCMMQLRKIYLEETQKNGGI